MTACLVSTAEQSSLQWLHFPSSITFRFPLVDNCFINLVLLEARVKSSYTLCICYFLRGQACEKFSSFYFFLATSHLGPHPPATTYIGAFCACCVAVTPAPLPLSSWQLPSPLEWVGSTASFLWLYPHFGGAYFPVASEELCWGDSKVKMLWVRHP